MIDVRAAKKKLAEEIERLIEDTDEREFKLAILLVFLVAGLAIVVHDLIPSGWDPWFHLVNRTIILISSLWFFWARRR